MIKLAHQELKPVWKHFSMLIDHHSILDLGVDDHFFDTYVLGNGGYLQLSE